MKTPLQLIVSDRNVSPALRGLLLEQRGLYTDLHDSVHEYHPTDAERDRMALEEKAEEDNDRQREDDAGINGPEVA